MFSVVPLPSATQAWVPAADPPSSIWSRNTSRYTMQWQVQPHPEDTTAEARQASREESREHDERDRRDRRAARQSGCEGPQALAVGREVELQQSHLSHSLSFGSLMHRYHRPHTGVQKGACNMDGSRNVSTGCAWGNEEGRGRDKQRPRERERDRERESESYATMSYDERGTRACRPYPPSRVGCPR